MSARCCQEVINQFICPKGCILTQKSSLKSYVPAGSDGAVKPERALAILRPVDQWELGDIKHWQAVVYVAFHTHLHLFSIWLVGIHVHEPRDHVRGEGHNECLQTGKERVYRKGETRLYGWWAYRYSPELTFVTTERVAIPLRISCQAPMLWAFDATGRLNWVVSFQASTLTSMMLLISANRGAKGKEATNSVMKPNWITEIERGMRSVRETRIEPGCRQNLRW